MLGEETLNKKTHCTLRASLQPSSHIIVQPSQIGSACKLFYVLIDSMQMILKTLFSPIFFLIKDAVAAAVGIAIFFFFYLQTTNNKEIYKRKGL